VCDLQNNTSLRELTLTFNSLSFKGALVLAQVLKVRYAQCMAKYRARWNTDPATFPSDAQHSECVVLFCMHACCVTARCAAQVNRTLEVLNLQDNRLGDAGAALLAEMLEVRKVVIDAALEAAAM
jgi:hypothetical protein